MQRLIHTGMRRTTRYRVPSSRKHGEGAPLALCPAERVDRLPELAQVGPGLGLAAGVRSQIAGWNIASAGNRRASSAWYSRQRRARGIFLHAEQGLGRRAARQTRRRGARARSARMTAGTPPSPAASACDLARGRHGTTLAIRTCARSSAIAASIAVEQLAARRRTRPIRSSSPPRALATTHARAPGAPSRRRASSPVAFSRTGQSAQSARNSLAAAAALARESALHSSRDMLGTRVLIMVGAAGGERRAAALRRRRRCAFGEAVMRVSSSARSTPASIHQRRVSRRRPRQRR